jgi:hypothetical protein
VTDTLAVLAQGAASKPPSGTSMLVIGSGLLALVLALILWPILAVAATIAHEGGHALAATLSGGSVSSMTVQRNRSGLTKFSHRSPLGTFLTMLAGYVGPSAFGLIGSLLLANGQVSAVLWLSLACLVLALIQIRNVAGAMAIVFTGAVFVFILKFADPTVRTFFSYTWIWFLLIAGFGDVLELRLIRKRMKVKDTSTDVGNLRTLTHLPGFLWMGFFGLATLAALVYGGGILLGIVATRT